MDFEIFFQNFFGMDTPNIEDMFIFVFSQIKFKPYFKKRLGTF